MAGCELKDFYLLGNRIYPLEFANDYNGEGSDMLTVNYIDYSRRECIETSNSADDLPTLTLKADMPVSSSEATINEEFDDTPYDAWVQSFYCNGTEYGGSSSFQEFMAIITSPDGSKSDIVWVTETQNVGTEDKVQNHAYLGYTNKIINSYPAGSTLSFFRADKLTRYRYFLSNNNLIRQRVDIDSITGAESTEDQVIAVNIEDLQFRFWLDTDDNGTIDARVGEAGGDLDLSDPEKSQVRLVEIYVLGRTNSQHRGYSEARPAILDHAAGTTNDGYRRKQLQVTVKVRNLGL